MLEKKINESYRALKIGAQMSKEYYGKPLAIAYSGGKDSDVLINLAIKILKPEDMEVYHAHTTVDAPETVYHIRKVFKSINELGIRTTIKKPTYKGEPTTMWKLIADKGTPPTRVFRYCCSVLKESSMPNRIICTGVRKSESVKRRGRGSFEVYGKTAKDALFFSTDHADEVYRESHEIQDENWDCNLIKNTKQNNDLIVNPIIDWTDTDVWDYLRSINWKWNPLYDRGYHRIGCIGCPLGGHKSMVKEFEDYPKYKENYIRAFGKMLKKRETIKIQYWTDAEHVFKWWIQDDTIDGQITIDEWLGEKLNG